jgi:hypothetical protein
MPLIKECSPVKGVEETAANKRKEDDSSVHTT